MGRLLKPWQAFIAGISVACVFFLSVGFRHSESTGEAGKDQQACSLGVFSVSLAVENLQRSLSFYEKLGFSVFSDHSENNYVILKNGNCIIGLFQGMFDKNILTFNPGWDENAQNLETFKDVREWQKEFIEKGIPPLFPVDSTRESGPNNLVLLDPDGNPILLDQHR